METRADFVLQLLLYTLPSIPGETADPSAFIVSITSLSHFGRPRCLHVFVNKLHNMTAACLGIAAGFIISVCSKYLQTLLERLESHMNAMNAFCPCERTVSCDLSAAD